MASKGKKAGGSKSAFNKPVAKKPKVEKDPNAPQKPASAYHLYMKANKDAIKKRYPGDTVQKKAGELWKALEVNEKSVWEDMAKDAKRNYEEELKDYESSKEGLGTSGSKDKKKEKPSKKKKTKSSDDEASAPTASAFSSDDDSS